MQGYMDIVKPSGSVHTKVYNNKTIPHSDLSDAIGGHFELIPMFLKYNKDGKEYNCIAFCDEDGKGKGLEYNHIAQLLWSYAVGAPVTHDLLAGNIAVCYGDQEFLRSL